MRVCRGPLRTPEPARGANEGARSPAGGEGEVSKQTTMMSFLMSFLMSFVLEAKIDVRPIFIAPGGDEFFDEFC